MTGKQYADLVAAYLATNYGERGIAVYREVGVGKSIIGKNRKLDILLHRPSDEKVLGIECKYQRVPGTTEEKIPYALKDAAAMLLPGCVSYAGDGFSEGVIHMLRAAENAVYCEPDSTTLVPTPMTLELDHYVAAVFGLWKLVLRNKTPFDLDAWTRTT